MMKHLSLMGSMLALALAANAADFYTQDFTTADNADGWLVVDANQDENTWQFNIEGIPSHFFYSYSWTKKADDWAISPEITFPEDGQFMVKIFCTGSTYREAMEVYTGSSQSPEAMTDLHIEMNDIPGDPTMAYFFMEGKAGETFHLGIHATSEPDRWRLYLNQITIGKCDNPVDLRVSEVISPISAPGLNTETVTVKVANIGLADVESFQVAYSVNGELQATETVNAHLGVGETMEYSFATPADLSMPRQNYEITAWTIHPDDFLPTNDAASAKVRHIAPAAIPYYMGFEADEDTSGITIFNLNNDTGDWAVNISSGWFQMSRTGYGCIAYNYDKENDADDWAIMEPIAMEAGHYALKFWYSGTDGHAEKLRVCWGTEATPEAMTNVIVEYNPITNGRYEESINIVEIPESGDIFFGFYAFSDKDENWLTIDDLSIVKVDANSSDVMVSEISQPWTYVREANKKDVSFTMRNIGIADKEVNAKVYIDEALVKEVPVTVKAMEFKDVTIESLIAGLAEGEHILRIDAEVKGDVDDANNVAELTFNVVGTPFVLWDFEDAQLPEGFIYRSEDGGTVHPGAGDEFNEDGFGIFNLGHYLLGEHALAVCTWLDDTYGSADRWVIMPQMHVNAPGAHFVWEAVSLNPDYLEKYNVKVSKTSTEWWSFEEVLSVPQESVYVKTRGISLDEYVGEDVYVAINARTAEGEALVLDNLGFYGDIQYAVESGVKGIETEASASADAEYYTLDGVKVDNPHGGIFIRVQDGKAAKVAIR